MRLYPNAKFSNAVNSVILLGISSSSQFEKSKVFRFFISKIKSGIVPKGMPPIDNFVRFFKFASSEGRVVDLIPLRLNSSSCWRDRSKAMPN